MAIAPSWWGIIIRMKWASAVRTPMGPIPQGMAMGGAPLCRGGVAWALAPSGAV